MHTALALLALAGCIALVAALPAGCTDPAPALATALALLAGGATVAALFTR